MNRILSVSLFCEVCSVVAGSISWARCLPVGTAESALPPFLKNWHISLHLLLKSVSSLQRHFLRVVDERMNRANSYENQLA